MRDFHDAKAMAQTLRDTLAGRAVTISHSESLEFIAKIFGLSDWNTLSARLLTDRQKTATSVVSNYPAIPIRDFVPFPKSTFPLYVGRDKTIRALAEAFDRHREIVLLVQKDPKADEPGAHDVLDIGLFATVLELEKMPDGLKFKDVDIAPGTMKVVVHAHRRVIIRRFLRDGAAFNVEIDELAETPFADNDALIQETVKRFESYALANKIDVPRMWPPLSNVRDAGHVADVIAHNLPLPLAEKHQLLITSDTASRLKKIAALTEA